MESKLMFLFALIATIKLVNSVPVAGGPVDGLIGGRKRGDGVNEDGILHGLNGILAEPLCSHGLGCDDCDGLLESLQPPFGGTVNSLGLGVDCDGEQRCGNGKGSGSKPCKKCRNNKGGDGDGNKEENEDDCGKNNLTIEAESNEDCGC